MSNESIVTILRLVTEAMFVRLGHQMFRGGRLFVADWSMQQCGRNRASTSVE